MSNQYYCYVKFVNYTEEKSGQKIISTEIVPQEAIKHKNGKPFEPRHQNDFDTNMTMVCKWKGSGENDDKKDYDITILFMGNTKKSIENWLKLKKIELPPPGRTHARNSNRDIKAPARYSPPSQHPTKSNTDKGTADASKKNSVTSEKEKSAQQKISKNCSQVEVMEVLDELEKKDPTRENEKPKQEAELQDLKKENATLRSTVKKHEQSIFHLELEIGSHKVDYEKRTREYNNLACQFATVSRLNTELHGRLTSIWLSKKKNEEIPQFLDDPPMKRVKSSTPEESEEEHKPTSVQPTSADMKSASSPTSVPKESQQHFPTYNQKVDTSMDQNYSDETNAHEASLEDSPETLAQPSTSKGNNECGSSGSLWLPTWPEGMLRENDNGTMVELMDGVWLSTRQWDGIESSKDCSKFIKELAFALCGDDLGNRSFTGKKSNRSTMKDEPVKPAIDEKLRRVIIGYYIQYLKKEDNLYDAQTRDKVTKKMEIDMKKVCHKLSGWIGEKSYSVRSAKGKNKQQAKQ
ncbi:hypothetical protein B566_EDAN016564 [Ephemera danica]|nr:hypothetical protein B566_EDAN016564 [Ephemera danica]